MKILSTICILNYFDDYKLQMNIAPTCDKLEQQKRKTRLESGIKY